MRFFRQNILLLTGLLSSTLSLVPVAFAGQPAPWPETESTGSSSAAATTDEWGDEEWGDDPWAEESTEQKPQWHGFIEAGLGQFLKSENPTEENQSLAELRARLENEWYFGDTYLRLKADIQADAVTDQLDGVVREAFFSLSPASDLDLRIGRQVLTWGTGDLVFLNDLFPKDWQSFFSGRDMEYLKAAADAVRLTWYQSKANVDLVWVPFFESDIYITGERFSYYNPMAGTIVAAPPELAVKKRSDDLENGELALRLYQTIGNYEWALYGYQGFYKQPKGFIPVTGQQFFPKMNAFGASLRGPAGPGIINTELAYHDSKQDSNGSNPWIPNSELRFLIGYEQELIRNLSLAAQYYLEQIVHYQQLLSHSPSPHTEAPHRRHTVTLRLTYRAMQEKLRWSLFSFYSPNDKDAYLIPALNYRYSDNWSFESGANIFIGDQSYSFLGQLQKNDNIYMRSTYRF